MGAQSPLPTTTITRNAGHDDTSETLNQRPDADLIADVRSGDLDAFAELWQRHKDAARSMALRLTNGRDGDDLPSEAFARILSAFQHGRGPDDSFRPYLSCVLRNLNTEDYRRYGRSVAVGSSTEIELFTTPVECEMSDSDNLADREMAVAALNTLDDDDFNLLWRSLIAEESNADTAEHLGVSDSTVRVRASRARERLRQAFLFQHIVETDVAECASVRRHMPALVRETIGAPRRKRVMAHTRECVACLAAMQELVRMNHALNSGAARPASRPVRKAAGVLAAMCLPVAAWLTIATHADDVTAHRDVHAHRQVIMHSQPREHAAKKARDTSF